MEGLRRERTSKRPFRLRSDNEKKNAMETIRGQLSALYIQHEAIEAQKLMVNSPNHTVVYIPAGAMGVPLTGTFNAVEPSVREPRRLASVFSASRRRGSRLRRCRRCGSARRRSRRRARHPAAPGRRNAGWGRRPSPGRRPPPASFTRIAASPAAAASLGAGGDGARPMRSGSVGFARHQSGWL